MKNSSWGVALRMMVNISTWIVFPVIIGLYLGSWLDKRFNTTPWLFLLTIGLAFFISIYGLSTSTLKEFKRIDRENQNRKNQNQKNISDLKKK